MRKAFLFVGLALALAACIALPVSTATPRSEAMPSASKLAKRTRSAAAKRTPTPSPSKAPKRTRSPKASATPEMTGSPSAVASTAGAGPTIPAPSAAPTATTPSELDCKLIWQSPSNRASVAPLQKFSVGWNVKNTGTAAWDAGGVELVYLGGAKLHNDGGFQLDRTVAPGERIVLSVAMKAPRNSTKYTTYWGLRQGDTFFCRLMLTIYVRRR